MTGTTSAVTIWSMPIFSIKLRSSRLRSTIFCAVGDGGFAADCGSGDSLASSGIGVERSGALSEFKAAGCVLADPQAVIHTSPDDTIKLTNTFIFTSVQLYRRCMCKKVHC